MAKKKRYNKDTYVFIKPIKKSCPKCEKNGKCVIQRQLVEQNKKKAYVYWPKSSQSINTNKAECFLYEGQLFFRLVGDKYADNH